MMRRRGYTYAELLVVITVIGVLVALLLPAVQACREAARRSTCSMHLVQLITAVQNYEMHHGVYPPGTVNAQGPILAQPTGYHHNWIIQILPFLELKNVSRNVDSSVGVYDPRHNTLRKMQFAVLHCPSFTRRGTGYSDYAGVHHDYEAPIDVDNNGVFFLNSRIQYENLWDGSANTLFIGEKWSPRGDLGWMSGTRATLRNGGAPINSGGGFTTWTGFGGFNRDQVEPTGSPLDESATTDADDGWTDERLILVLLGPRDSVGPGGPGNGRRKIPPRPKIAALAVGGFSSPHPGGSQFALGDGSVRFLSSTIDVRTYANLANRADGNIISADF